MLGNDSLAVLAKASAAINSDLELRAILERIAGSAQQSIGADSGKVLLLDKYGGKLVCVAAVGQQSNAMIALEFDAVLGVAGRVIQHGKTMVVTGAEPGRDFYSGWTEDNGAVPRDLLAAPMIHQGEVIGVVELLAAAGAGCFGPEAQKFLPVFADFAAIATRTAQVHETLKRTNPGLRETILRRNPIIGRCEAIRHVLRLCDRVAHTNATVLLLGETGTGKELIAKYIHNGSNRVEKPFVAVNCAALPETLLESELFGHEKGSFTGAVSRKIGRFEQAAKGTLFLDEIGDIPPSIQVKLLRMLEERSVVRVGGTENIHCDVRFVAASNRNLKRALQEEQFREDLYYRLNVFPIHLPPLRERRDDIPVLVNHFVERASLRVGVPTRRISNDAMALLMSHRWPGNIRELQNAVERAVLLCDGDEVLPIHLPHEISGDGDDLPAQRHSSGLRSYERAMIVKALRDCGWNQSEAARTLSISRDNLRYRLRKYAIEKPS